MTAEAKYDMTVYPVTVQVRSASDGARVHNVTLPSCDCADFINRKGRLAEDEGSITICKHIAEALARVGGWHRAPEPEHDMRYENLTRSAVVEILAGAWILRDTARVGLDRLNSGSPAFFPRLGKSTIEVRVSPGASRRYTVVVPA